MHRFLLILSLVLIACGGETPIWPDSTTGAGGMSASSSATSASSGQGSGAGGGLSCDPCENKNGTRIVNKRTRYSAQDGYQHVYDAASFDTLLGIDCSFVTAEDGVLRCLPGYVYVMQYFADAACTDAVYAMAASDCAPAPKYLGEVLPGNSPCDSGSYRIRHLGTEHVGPVYTKVGNNCNTTTLLPGYKTYRYGAVVPPTDFVAITKTVE